MWAIFLTLRKSYLTNFFYSFHKKFVKLTIQLCIQCKHIVYQRVHNLAGREKDGFVHFPFLAVLVLWFAQDGHHQGLQCVESSLLLAASNRLCQIHNLQSS